MRRNYLYGLILVLIPNVIAGVFIGLAFYQESEGKTGFRRGIDLAGGTILVYEVNLDRTRERLGTTDQVNPNTGATGLSADDIKKLAESLKRRIDPADLRNVVVRPVGTTRVEIILPFSNAGSGESAGITEDFVQEVKNLVSQVGVLEFRIVANPTDDREAIQDARNLLARADTDPAFKAELEERARRGLPPPAPRGESGNGYSVKVNGQKVDNTSYEWVELGREERFSLGLSNEFATDPPKRRDGTQGTWLYPLLAARRAQVWPETIDAYPALLYSREFTKATPSRDEEGKKVEYFVLTRVSPVDAMRVDREVGLQANVGSRGLDPAVTFQFNPAGANRFGKLTERNRKTESFKRQLAVIMDEKIVSAPTLDAVIRDSGTISGSGFDMGSVTRLANIMRSGALNAELKPDPVSENTVGPTLGQDTIRKGLMAVAAAYVVVLVFMVIYYRFAGLVACIALFSNLFLTVGFMVAVNAAFTLPGLAGIVLMLGMAVDANVLIYERLREERDKGANLATAIRLGYDRAFYTIIDTHLTSIFTSVVLYTFGNDNLKGFAVSLTVGLIISLFTSLYMTRLVFDYAIHRRVLTNLRMLRFFSRPRFDFMRIRHYMFALTAVLTFGGLGLFLYRGEASLNVDFTKGSLYGGRLKTDEARTMSQLLALLGEEAQRERLQVKPGPDGVIWRGAPTTTDDGRTRAADWTYQVNYADGASAIVTISPDEAWTRLTEDEQLADLRERASKLPGLSVESVKLSGLDDDLSGGKTRSFAVRTTEKEPELVQVMLDRLLRNDQGEQLLAAANVTGVTVDGPVATVKLDRPASPKYFAQFVTRQLKLENRVPTLGAGIAAEVTGVPDAADQQAAIDEARSGRFKVLRVDVSQNPEFRALKEAADSDARAALVGPASLVKPAAVRERDVFAQAIDGASKSFEARPVPDRLETFDPALAEDTRNRAFYAILLSWVAIVAYLWFRFGNWTFGLAAVLCLIHDLCFTLGAIAACHYVYDTQLGRLLGLHDFKIDLAAVAALLTLVGYSVNEIIVNFARIREVRGKNPALTPQMINDSVNQTLSRTILTSTTVFLVSFVLYTFGGEGVHLFAFVMATGVLISTYSSIYIASPLLLIFGEGKGKTPIEAPKPESPTPTAAREEELVV